MTTYLGMWQRVAAIATFATMITGLVAGPAMALPRIHTTAGPFTVAEGGTIDLVISLDEPMICIEADPCELVLDFTDSFSEFDVVVPAEVVWDATEWAQTRTITVTAGTDPNSSVERVVTFAAVADSGSVYFDGLEFDVDVTITKTLAETGLDITAPGLLATVLLSAAIATRITRLKMIKALS